MECVWPALGTLFGFIPIFLQTRNILVSYIWFDEFGDGECDILNNCVCIVGNGGCGDGRIFCFVIQYSQFFLQSSLGFII